MISNAWGLIKCLQHAIKMRAGWSLCILIRQTDISDSGAFLLRSWKYKQIRNISDNPFHSWFFEAHLSRLICRSTHYLGTALDFFFLNTIKSVIYAHILKTYLQIHMHNSQYLFRNTLFTYAVHKSDYAHTETRSRAWMLCAAQTNWSVL